jgi:integrase
MATLTVRDGKYHVLNWTDDSGERHRTQLGRVGILTKRQLADILKAKQLEESTGAKLLGIRLSRAPFFGVYAVDYLEWHALEYPDSNQRVDQIVRDYLLERWQYTRLDAIPEKQVEQYKQDRKRAGAKANTIIKELRVLRAIVNRAVAKRIITASPIASVKDPQVLDAKPHRFYEASELGAIYDACRVQVNGGEGPQPDPVHAFIWKLYANTGMRRREGLHLRRQWVGSDGMKIVSTGEERTKSGDWREIPLTDGAREALEALPRDGQYVVPQVAPASLSRAFKKDAVRAAMDGSLHTLRHTYISHLVRDGVPLRTVQIYAGHAHYSTTEEYAYLAPGATPRAVSTLAL